MEFNSNAEYLASFPPKLEDAGLEDCALPPEGIQEAFRLAAEKVRAAAEGVVGVVNSMKQTEVTCTHNPEPSNGLWEDACVDTAGIGPQGRSSSCVETHTGGLLEEGEDLVVDPGFDKKEDKLVGVVDTVPKLGDEGCIEGDLGGLGGIPGASEGSPGIHGSTEGGEARGPTLAEGYL